MQETVSVSMKHSICYGALDEADQLVGFARVLTDYATTFYLCDVIVEEALRGKGIGKLLLRSIAEDDRLQGQMGFLLTQDAHSFYEPFGFRSEDGRFMRKPKETK